MCRAQLLQSYPAEMRDNLLFGERQIPLACLVGEMIGVTQPVANMLSDGKPGRVDNGTAVDPSRLTVAEHVRDWLRNADHLANKTRERYLALAEQQIIPHLGGVALQKLRPAHIADWHTTLLRSGGNDGRPLSAR